VLLAVDLDEDFIDEEGVTVAPMLSFQSARIDRAKLDAPETDGFAGYSDASLSEKIFYISVAEVESVVEPNCVGNYVGWESVAFICIHRRIVSISVI
jgi:hypothetical protein